MPDIGQCPDAMPGTYYICDIINNRKSTIHSNTYDNYKLWLYTLLNVYAQTMPLKILIKWLCYFVVYALKHATMPLFSMFAVMYMLVCLATQSLKFNICQSKQ